MENCKHVMGVEPGQPTGHVGTMYVHRVGLGQNITNEISDFAHFFVFPEIFLICRAKTSIMNVMKRTISTFLGVFGSSDPPRRGVEKLKPGSGAKEFFYSQFELRKRKCSTYFAAFSERRSAPV